MAWETWKYDPKAKKLVPAGGFKVFWASVGTPNLRPYSFPICHYQTFIYGDGI